MNLLRNFQNILEYFQHYSFYPRAYFQSLTLGFDPIIDRQHLPRLLPYSMPQSINYRYIIFIITNFILFVDTFVQLYLKPDNVREEDLWLFHQVSYPISGYNQQVKIMFVLGYET